MGFRKWCEREWLSSHAHMALALISAVATMASFEAFRGGRASEKVMDTAFVMVCAAITLWCMRRCLYLLMHAEDMAHQAHRAQGQAYGLLKLQEGHERGAGAQWLVPTCCKRCGFRWDLQDD